MHRRKRSPLVNTPRENDPTCHRGRFMRKFKNAFYNCKNPIKTKKNIKLNQIDRSKSLCFHKQRRRVITK